MSELAVLQQKYDCCPEWRFDRICDRLWYGFDWEQIWFENKIARHGGLTPLLIWQFGESLLYLSFIFFVSIGFKDEWF